MPSYGDYHKEIKTIADLKELVRLLTEVHGMKDDCEIWFNTGLLNEDVKVFCSGDISYSSNSAHIDTKIEIEYW